MKKTLIFILSISLAFALSFSSFASNKTYVYEYDNITVVFDETTPFSLEQRKNIADKIVNGTENTATYGLWCTLFGHDYVEDTVMTITHCVNDTQPRCLEEYFDIGECSRCGDTYANRISYGYITCCP
jgi:hypothetical protein